MSVQTNTERGKQASVQRVKEAAHQFWTSPAPEPIHPWLREKSRLKVEARPNWQRTNIHNQIQQGPNISILRRNLKLT